MKTVERYAVLVVWALVVAFFAWRSDTFAATSTVQLILSTQTVILIATLGVTFSLAVQEFDLSVGSVVGFGGCLLAVLDGREGWAPGPAIAVTLLVCALFGAINAALSVLAGVPSIIVTLGTGTLLAGITLGVTESKVVTGISVKTVQFMTSPFLFGIPAPFYCGLVLCLVAWFVLQHTPLGRRMIFIAENREVARLAGLRVNLIRAGALVVTATLSGLAGVVLAGTNSAANPQSGAYYLLPAFAAAFLGSTTIVPGRFNAWGAFVAVYFLTTGITGLQYLGYAGWPEQVFYGGSLVAAVTLSHLAGHRRLPRFA
ncbi:sugar ABC transporter permease [Acrocarpospora phusangensis]|uniref:Sugar ABC transporter permease n=1 Tax=Acrocarpospora phusangensis TaxID=1070424 RepID=A0A919QI33_9ACTN|nr:ABC transporter permease [Acrocarpospora phusangensis]GIH27810.1 sugar ABC transporter permease [Acrocarpospora phusangensis]